MSVVVVTAMEMDPGRLELEACWNIGGADAEYEEFTIIPKEFPE